MSAPILTVTVEPAERGIAIRCAGEIDLSSAPDLDRAAGSAVDDRPARVELDLRQVGFIDSSGLASVLRVSERARAAGADFVVRPSEQVRRVVQLSGVELALDG
jgi:anti-sigma B factor antagonist